MIKKRDQSNGVTTVAAIKAGGHLAWLFYTQKMGGWERFRSAVVEGLP